MCFDAKSSFLNASLGFFLCFLLWLRNHEYDRMFSVVLLSVIMVQVIEGLYYIGYSPEILGKSLYLLFFFQLFLFAFLIRLDFGNAHKDFKNIWLAITLILLISAIYQTTKSFFTLKTSGRGKGHLQYIQKSSTNTSIDFMTLPFGIGGTYFYLFFIFLPFLYLAVTTQKNRYWIYILYLILSLYFSYIYYPIENVGSLWCYLSVGLIFLIWFFGIFN